MKENYSQIVDKIVNNYDSALELSAEEIISLTEAYSNLIKNQPILARIKQGSVLVSGDIHGDFTILKQILTKFLNKKIADHLVFLGDIVDRGTQSMGCLNLLFALILKHPKNIHIIRGNHESIPINSRYGLLEETLKFSGIDEELFNYSIEPQSLPEIYVTYNKAFGSMPLALVHDKLRYFFVHGGIPIEPTSLNSIKKLPKNNLMLDHPIIKQLLWNDPTEINERYGNSMRGGGIFTYGEELVTEFLESNHLEKIIRAHEVVESGYRYMFNDRLLSMFTSQEYYTYVTAKLALMKENGEIKSISPDS